MVSLPLTRFAPVLVAALLLAPACNLPEDQVGERHQRIINGEIDETHTSVVALVAWNYHFCSGTVIAPRAVLTAGHCVRESHIRPEQMSVFFGTSVGDGSSSVDVVKADVHPDYYIRMDGAPMNDVAVLTLADDAPVTPMQWQRTPLEDITGETVTLVGYGVTDAYTQTGSGTRRVVDQVVNGVDEDFIYYGSGYSGTCQGDSGGPMFLSVGDRLVLVGVTSWGDQSCVRLGGNARVDKYADFIAPKAQLPVAVSILSPGTAATMPRDFTVEVDAVTDAGVAQVEILVDGEPYGTVTEPPWIFELWGLEDGEHNIQAKAVASDTAIGVASIQVTVVTASAGSFCTVNGECQSGICIDGSTGNGYCSQPCMTDLECPDTAACWVDVGAAEGYCGPLGSAAVGGGEGGGCSLAGGRTEAAGGLLLLCLAGLLVLVPRRRR